MHGYGSSRWLFRRTRAARVDKVFRRGQLLSAALYSLGHGGNDAQKTMGIIFALLIAASRQRQLERPAQVPIEVVLACHAGDGAGHAARRLADRQDDGPADHPAAAGGRLLCGDRGGDHAGA